jgi:hypothetical protein
MGHPQILHAFGTSSAIAARKKCGGRHRIPLSNSKKIILSYVLKADKERKGDLEGGFRGCQRFLEKQDGKARAIFGSTQPFDHAYRAVLCNTRRYRVRLNLPWIKASQ